MASALGETIAQLQLVQKGGPFQVVQVPKPSVNPDEVLIRQVFVGLNGLDWKQRDSGMFVPRWPHVLGVEGAGVIEAIGSDVKDLQLGDEVAAWEVGMVNGDEWGGAYQEYLVMPARWVAKMPSNVSLEQAASLPICYATAICAIHSLGLDLPIPGPLGKSGSSYTPTSILILGGSSSIGANAIQLLRLVYPSVPIFATSSPKNQAQVLSLGATQVFDYHKPGLVSSVKAASPKAAGVDMIIDCLGAGASQTDICDSFDPAGSKKYAAILCGITVPVPEDVTHIEIDGMVLLELDGGEHVIPALTDLLERGKYQVPLPVRIVGQYLSAIPDVMDQVKTVSGTKLVVQL
ncbi:hypothetical protein PISL3812_00977 [Talaromyces islandicus]|uniref:Enoyl reductase (ER) domain-containing protein n=1 Tax=Talaromyces islandicus TaxID=28573 RepID=A0A0U1LKW3_TALIS|nr:hypothetical protein PISL3812_00977 [Talaromyces islandicus]